MKRLLLLGAFLAFAPATAALAQQASNAPPAQQTSDASAAQQPAADLPPGQRTFNQCRACHTTREGARTLIGPNLYGIFGRRTASVEGYRYSVNMKQLGDTGHVWSEQTLRPYLTNPRDVVPQTAMQFPGVPDEAELNALLPLLKKATGGG